MPRASLTLLGLCTLAMLGCAYLGPIDARQIRAGEIPALAADEGILVVRIETNVPIAKLEISGSALLTDLSKGEHLYLLAVRAGRYRWSGFALPAEEGNVRFKTARSEFWRFRVEPGHTSYPGNFTFRGKTGKTHASIAPIRFQNRSALVLRTLRDRFPGLLERYPPTYTGQKDDGYLDYFSATALGGRPAADGQAPQ